MTFRLKTINFALIIALSLFALPISVSPEALASDPGGGGNFCPSDMQASITITNRTTGNVVSATANGVGRMDTAIITTDPGDTLLVEMSGYVGPSDGGVISTLDFQVTEGTTNSFNESYDDGGMGSGISWSTSYQIDSVSTGGDASSTANGCDSSWAYISINVNAPTPDFTLSCSPTSTTIAAASNTSFNLATTGSGGFNSAVAFSNTISPNSGTLPTISYANNNQVPSAITTANIATTASTTPATYTITFTGTGGGITRTCNVTLTVTPYSAPPGSYTLTVSPVSADVLSGSDMVFTVTAVCNNGAPGPIFGLAASSAFTGVTYAFSNTTVNCGASVTLTVGNTDAIPIDQASTPQTRLGQSLTVTGSGI